MDAEAMRARALDVMNEVDGLVGCGLTFKEIEAAAEIVARGLTAAHAAGHAEGVREERAAAERRAVHAAHLYEAEPYIRDVVIAAIRGQP
jgi:hypothetical protein